MLPRDRRPIPHRVQTEVAPPATLRLLYEIELLARERQIEARIGEVRCERDRISGEDQGRLVFLPRQAGELAGEDGDMISERRFRMFQDDGLL